MKIAPTGMFAAAIFCCGRLAAAGQSIPFQLDDNLVHVNTTINGQAASAVLDSGAVGIAVNRASASRLKVIEGAPIGVDAGGGTRPAQLFSTRLTKIVVGPVTLENVSGVTMDTSGLAQSAGFPIDALIGWPVFKEKAVRVDYAARRVTFFESARPPQCDAPIPIEIRGKVPITNVELRATKESSPTTLHMIVDLGTRHFATIIGGRYLKTDEGHALMSRGVLERIGTGTGGAIAGTRVVVGELKIGDRVFSDLTVAMTDQIVALEKGLADGTLGVPLWQNGAMTFDYQKRQLCLSVPPEARHS